MPVVVTNTSEIIDYLKSVGSSGGQMVVRTGRMIGLIRQRAAPPSNLVSIL
jgi:hypothetical protein